MPAFKRKWFRNDLWRSAFLQHGAVAIETAILVPVLCAALLLLVDTVRFIRTASRMDRVASVTADIIARTDTLIDRTDFTAPLYNNELGTYLLAANRVAEPDDLAADGQVIVSSIAPTGSGFSLNWQRTGPYRLNERSRLEDLPPLPQAGSFIVVEVLLRFHSALLETAGILSPSDALVYRRAIFRPRLASLATLEPPP